MDIYLRQADKMYAISLLHTHIQMLNNSYSRPTVV